MSKLTRFLSNIKLVYRPVKWQTKVALMCVIVLSMVTLLGLHIAITGGEARNEALTSQAATLELQNSQLESDIAQLGSDDSVVDIAGEELGLVDPDTVIFVPDN